MSIVAAVVALELCLFLVPPSTWLAPAALCSLGRVLQSLAPARNNCELQNLSATCGLDTALDLLCVASLCPGSGVSPPAQVA